MIGSEMTRKKYTNFVRSSSPCDERIYPVHPNINGDEARKLYLEEVKDVGDPEPAFSEDNLNKPLRKQPKRELCRVEIREVNNKDLFLSAQNNDVETLKAILNRFPDKINILDDYGWSLLMISCQANSVETVTELLNRNINTSIRDKAGNSAQSLIIKNKNIILADLLLKHKRKHLSKSQIEHKHKKIKLKKEFTCEICNKTFPDKQEHLSSTVHNIHASKGKKIPVNYVIPASNRGYQLMLKGGWDRLSGLGPDGIGRNYPIKAVQKKDRKGLGNKQKETEKIDIMRQVGKNMPRYQDDRRMEINFRREFY